MHFLGAGLPISILLALAVPPQAPQGPTDLDFEMPDLGSPGSGGWFFPPSIAESYRVTIVEENPRSGKRCVFIESKAAPKPGDFGNVMQSFDASPYRGRRVRFRGAVRTQLDGPRSRAQLWLRVDRQGGQLGFFDNMGDRPITAREWEEYEITGDVAADAAAINIGCMLIGSGKVWFDAASFEVAGVAREGNEPPKELDGRALENLAAFTRLLGYVRHFHPSDGAAAADWNAFAIDGVRAVENARGPTELARTLEALFRPLAPTVRVHTAGKRPPPPAELAPPKEAAALKVTAWRHQGFGGGMTQSIYSSKRDSAEAAGGRIPVGFAAPAAPFAADLGGGVGCLVPLSLFADDRGTLPREAREPKAGSPRPMGFRPSGNDRATRLAAVALAWNVLQHFYPYFDVVKVDWPRALKDALRSAATDADEKAFLGTLRRLVAKIQDGHGYVSGPGAGADATPPLAWDWVESALVVTALGSGYGGKLQLGDVVLEVDGRPAAAALAAEEELISGATAQWRRSRALQELAAGELNSEMALKVKPRSGQVFTETVVRSLPPMTVREKRPEPIEEMKPGIFYVDLERVTDATFAAALPRLEKAQGIVFDLRTYPNSVTPQGVLSHSLDAPVTSAQWQVPRVRRPDHEDMEFTTSNWSVSPAAPRLRAKTAYITGGGAISFAETWLGIVEHYKLAAIVGGPTAGTNGNVNSVALPGGYVMAWTGMRVLKHDGSRHHGVGIQPSVPRRRTIQGIAAGRDELLLRAIEEVSR